MLSLLPLLVAALFLGRFAEIAAGQSMTLLPAFDPRIPGTDEDGHPYTMDTFVDAVSADGKTIVGHAQEFIRIFTPPPDEDGEVVKVLETKMITFQWRDGVYTKLPFLYHDGEASDPRLLGISQDGKKIYGVVSESELELANPALSVLENGVVTAAPFTPWVDFAHGLQGRSTPAGGWIGRSVSSTMEVNAVAADFTTFVGTMGEQAVVWTKDEVIKIPAMAGFPKSRANGVSANGRVVCGYFYGHDEEGLTNIGDGGFVWTRGTGAVLVRDMVRSDGFPFETNFASILAQVVGAEGDIVFGSTDGVDETGRAYVFRQVLGPAVSIVLPDQGFSVEEPFEAEVTVSSPTPQPQSISFPQGLMTSVEDTAALEFEPVEPFILTVAEPKRTFTVKVTPRSAGTLALTTDAVATSSKGTVDLTAWEEFHITPLKVSLRMLPLAGGKPTLNVELNEEGEVTDAEGRPVTPKIEITIENLSEKPVIGALQGVDPRARDRAGALGRIDTVADFPIDFESIVKGAPWKREIELEINEDGRFDFVALVTAREEEGTHGFTARARGAPLAVGDKFPISLEIKMVRTPAITNQNNGAIFVEPGSTVEFLATVENLTTNSTATFFGINAEKHLNVLGGRLTSDEGGAVDPPFVPDYEVKHGATEVLRGFVKTDVDGAPVGTLTWQGLENLVLVDDQTKAVTKLTMDDVLVTSTVTGWLDNNLSLRVIQDDSVAFPPPDLDIWETSAYWSYGALLAAGQWTYDAVDTFGGIGRLAGNVLGNPSLLADTWGEASRVVWEMGENASRTWNGMSAAQREELIEGMVSEVFRRGALLAATRSPFDQADYNAARLYATQATYGFFGGMEAAYASDDPAKIAQMWGGVSGNIAIEVATSLLPTPKFQAYSKGVEAALMATNLDAARLITSQDNILRTLKTGLVNSETVLKAWGVGGKHLDDIQAVFARFKVKGYMRERSPEAFRLIDTLKQAVLKPEAMKPKGLSEIDFLILDDVSLLPRAPGTNGEDLGLSGITAIFLPESDEIIAPRVRSRLIARGNYPSENVEEAVKACLERAQSRRKEFAEFVPEFEAWAADTVVHDGGIPVPRNYKDNGIPSPEEFENAKRGFSFERHAREGKEIIYIPKMKDADGVFKYISGDIDWIHFTFLNGSPLDSKTARMLYDAMFRACGLQHPETISWILNKQTVFKAKINQIGEFLVGQKALLEVTGSSTRAVHISQNLTRFAKDGRSHLIFFEGGIKARSRALLADAESALAYYQSLFPNPKLLLPFLQVSRFDKALQQAGGAEGDWTYSTAEGDSLILRENSDGAYQRFDGAKWVPWAPATPLRMLTNRESGSDTIHLAPTSRLAEAADAGSTGINVVNLPEQWPTALSGHVTNWFAAGMRIVIAPGEITQEVHIIAATSPMSLVTALKYAHPANTLVAVVPAGMVINEPSDTASALLSTVVDGERAYVTLIWQTLPGHQYVLEAAAAANPSVWSTVLTGLSASEGVLTVEVPLAQYSATSTYRLRKTGVAAPEPEFNIVSFTINRVAGTVTLVASSIPGHEYGVESTANPATGIWQILDPRVLAGGDTATITVPIDPVVKRMFYRVRDHSHAE